MLRVEFLYHFMRKTFFPISILAVIIFGLTSYDKKVSSNSSGAQAGRTGAPLAQGGNEGLCTDCHGGVVNTGPNSAAISISGNPAGFIADSTYQVTVSVVNHTGSKGGFQVVALDPSLNTVGTLSPIGTSSKIITGGGRTYLTHRNANSFSWTFTWKAPADALPDSVTFYTAVNETVNGAKKVYSTSRTFNRSILTRISSFTEKSRLSVFPFEASTEIFVSGLPYSLPTAKARIVSSEGRILSAFNLENNGLEGIKLPAGLGTGMYFLQVSAPGFEGMARFRKL